MLRVTSAGGGCLAEMLRIKSIAGGGCTLPRKLSNHHSRRTTRYFRALSQGRTAEIGDKAHSEYLHFSVFPHLMGIHANSCYYLGTGIPAGRTELGDQCKVQGELYIEPNPKAYT